MEKLMKVVMGIVVLVLIVLLNRACDEPLVFEDPNGVVCGCQVDTYRPGMDQCDRVNFKKPYQVIHVSTCGEEK
jgi:hypothetical protein